MDSNTSNILDVTQFKLGGTIARGIPEEYVFRDSKAGAYEVVFQCN